MKKLLLLAISFLVFNIPLAAQTSTGTLTGQVLDQNKAALPGATVTLTDIQTNSVRNMVTNETGVYVFSSLQPGSYQLKVEKEGFKTAIIQAVSVYTAGTTTNNISLEIGETNITVEINTESPLLTPDTPMISTTIENKTLSDLPFAERSALGVVLIAPGVSGDPQYQGGVQSENPGIFTQPVTPGGSLSMSGGRPGSGSILVDGADNTLVGYPRTGVSFSGDTVQEVTVQQNGLPAQYGRTGGGIINQSTKGGGNNFHGMAYWRYTGPSLQARTYGVPFGSQRRQNQFSFVGSGPVFLPAFGEGGPMVYNGRDRTFFFVSYEPLRFSDLTYLRSRLPTPDELRGDFNNSLELLNQNILRTQGIEAALNAPRVGGLFYQFALNAQGLPIGAQLPVSQFTPVLNNNLAVQLAANPVAQQILGLFPTVQNPGKYVSFLRPDGLYESDGNNVFAARGVESRDNRFTIRVDHRLFDSDQLSVRYTYVPVQGTRFNFFGPESPANEVPQDSTDSHNATLRYTKQFGSVVNEFRLTYTFSERFRGPSPVALDKDYGAELGLRPASLGQGFPALFGLGYQIGSGGSRADGGLSEDVNLGIGNDLSFVRGNHSIKIGGEARFLQLNREDNSNLVGGGYTFNAATTNSGSVGGSPLASFVLGIVNNYTVRTNAQKFYYRWSYYAAYIQDDWKLRPNLSLNFGLRYNLETPRSEKYNRQGSFDPNVTGTLNGMPVKGGFVFAGENGRPETLWKTNYLGFEPRVGIAYQPYSFMTLRASYSLVHTPLTGVGNSVIPDLSEPNANFINGAGGVNPAAFLNYLTNPVGNVPSPIVASGGPLFTFPGASYLPYVDPSNKVPYVQLFSFSSQFQISNNTFLELAYAGNKGTHLFNGPIDQNVASFEIIKQRIAEGANFVARNIPNQYGLGNMTLLESLRPYQQFYNNTIDSAYDRRGNSIYHAGYLSFRQRLSNNLNIQGSYTWSKSIDDSSSGSVDSISTDIFGFARVQNPFDLKAERSVSTFDIPHKFSTAVSYQLPFGKGQLFKAGNRIINYIISDINLSGLFTRQSGQPVFVQLGNPGSAAASGYFFSTLPGGVLGSGGAALQDFVIRPNIVLGVPIINPNWRNDPYGSSYLNPAAFEVPGSPDNPQLGNAPRTLPYARSPIVQFFDASASKRFGLGDTRRFFEVKVDVLNVLNRPNFYFGGGTGRNLISTLNPATGTFNLTTNFGFLASGAQSLGRTFQIRGKFSF